MTTTSCQTSIDPSQIQSTLESIGYKLHDFGNHWRTNALYRGGDNSTSLCIYKNSGVWTDFVHGSKSKPLEQLISLTLKSDQKRLKEVLASLKKSDEFVYYKKETIEMEEIYPEEILKKLFPNYTFYLRRNFEEKTLKFYKTGLAGSGKMYRRMVFPIYNEHKQIIGFSGRKVDDSDEQVPKWKHIGKRKNWIYPAYIPNEESIDSIIKNKREVILVESIGDSMALYQSGIKNNLVTFGLGISPGIINYLNSFELDKIIIATNNDYKSTFNYGRISAVNILLSLKKFFDLDKIEIKMPPNKHNDFSDAFQNGENLENWYNTPTDKKEYFQDLKIFIEKNYNKFKPKEISSLLKFLDNYE